MRILVIGGTQFTGRHLVRQLLEAGHEVVLLNRGQSNPGLFSDLRIIKCDRESEEIGAQLNQEKYFDAVVDQCAYFPRDVERILGALREKTGHYILISSVSAYRSLQSETIPFIKEDDPTLECTEGEAQDRNLTSYGQRKAECERVAFAQSHSGVPVTIFRPSLIYGPFDPTDRFAYWIWRVSQRKPFLLPENGQTIAHKTYAGDLAANIVKAIGNEVVHHRVYNIGETECSSIRNTIGMIGRHLGISVEDYIVSVSADQLQAQKVRPWMDLPLWIPRTHFIMDTFRARRDLDIIETPIPTAIGLTCDEFLQRGGPPIAGLSLEREQELLKIFTAGVSSQI